MSRVRGNMEAEETQAIARVATYGEGRTCVFPGCGATLSSYNRTDQCFHHPMRRKAVGVRKAITGARKGTCSNCERPDLSLYSAGLCSTCGNVARGLTGEAREKALAEIKAKIKAGLIYWGGHKKKTVKP